MASVNVTVDSTTYVLLTPSDALVQNVSSYPLRIIFASTLPAVDDPNYHLILPSNALMKSGGLPTGNIYARADVAGEDCKVIYSV